MPVRFLLRLYFVVLMSYACHVQAQVPYNDVLQLPFDEANHWLQYGDDSLQRIGVWPASDSQQSNIALIFIHGGCWLNAFDYQHGQAMFTALARRGIDVYAITYRRTGDVGGGWPGTYHDIKAALAHLSQQWLKNNKPARVVLAGHSAGGHLALLAGSQFEQDTIVNRVIGLAAITNPITYAQGQNSCQTATPLFFNGMPFNKPKDYVDATPNIPVSKVSFVTLHGDKDAIVPVDYADIPNATTIIVPNAGHFDWLHPETPAFNTFVASILDE